MRLFLFVGSIVLAAPHAVLAQEWAFWARAKPTVTGTPHTALPVYVRVSRIGADSIGAEEQLQRVLSDQLTREGFEVLPASIRRDDSVGDHIRIELSVFTGGAFAYRLTTMVFCRSAAIPNSGGEWTWRIRDGESSSSWTGAEAMTEARLRRSVRLPDLNADLKCDHREARQSPSNP
jgi:hypothetical protein